MQGTARRLLGAFWPGHFRFSSTRASALSLLSWVTCQGNPSSPKDAAPRMQCSCNSCHHWVQGFYIIEQQHFSGLLFKVCEFNAYRIPGKTKSLEVKWRMFYACSRSSGFFHSFPAAGTEVIWTGHYWSLPLLGTYHLCRSLWWQWSTVDPAARWFRVPPHAPYVFRDCWQSLPMSKQPQLTPSTPELPAFTVNRSSLI